MKPLADRMRAKDFSEVVGQEDVVLYLQASLPDPPSLLLWGPPGSGKTTIARILAWKSGMPIRTLSAVSDGLPALRKILTESEEEPLLLFVDEIHRWNKAQQDALLPYVENGRITLIGATTENPGYEINSALRSRMQLLRLESLSDKEIITLVERAAEKYSFSLTEEARDDLLLYAAGDARRALLLLDRSLALTSKGEITREMINQAAGERIASYGRHGERDDIVSAWIKSMRASDAEGALYWLARMHDGGEDTRFLARRLLVFASEDVGLADSDALSVASGVSDAVERVGEPECWINLAHGTSYMALAPKSWTSYRSWLRARQAADGVSYSAPETVHRHLYKHPADSEDPEKSFLPEDLQGKIWGES